MSTNISRPRVGALLAWLLAAAATSTQAQGDYPSRPVMLSVGFSAGGPTDTVARAIAQKLGGALGQAVVVENKPGADGRIQLQQLAKSPADGYRIGLADSGLTINALLFNVPPYSIRDFTPITYVGEMPNFIAVTPGLPGVASLKDFIAYAKARPGKLNYGATASSTILATEMLTEVTGLSITRVRYKGAAAAIPALVNGEIQMLVSATGTLAPMANQERIRALAVTSTKRSPLMPEVPTTAEAGLPNYTFVNWYAFVGPAGIPAPIVDKLNNALQKVLADPEIVAQLARVGVSADPASGARLAELLKSDLQKIDRIVTKANLSTD